MDAGSAAGVPSASHVGTDVEAQSSSPRKTRRDNYNIDLENDVAMRATPLLPLVQAPPVQYAVELAKYMVDETYVSFLTELGSQNMR